MVGESVPFTTDTVTVQHVDPVDRDVQDPTLLCPFRPRGILYMPRELLPWGGLDEEPRRNAARDPDARKRMLEFCCAQA